MISEDVLSTEYLGQNKEINRINPLVSVCVVTYNHASFIGECLDSILAQETEFPIEIIIGEDNSSDGTRDICKKYADKYQDKIRLFLRQPDQKIEVNGQKTFHFNFVENLKAARGKYIALCDGDDYWCDRTKLSEQAEILANNESLVLTGGKAWHIKQNEDYKILHEGKPMKLPNEILNTGDLIRKNPFVTSTIFFRNRIPEEFPEIFFKGNGGDRRLMLLLSEYGALQYMDKNYAVYRKHSGGVSDQSRTSLESYIENDKHRIYLARIWNNYFNNAYHADTKHVILSLYKRLYKNNFRVKHYIASFTYLFRYILTKHLKKIY